MWSKILAEMIHLYLVFVFSTSRWKINGYQPVLDNAAAKKPQIFAFWHGRVAMMPSFKPKNQRVFVMVSRHRDGGLLAAVMSAFGLDLIRGSSRRAGSNKERGGRSALLEAVNKLGEGHALAITPDGPRGPRMRVSGHVVTIAQMSGAEIIPMASSSSLAYSFKSWDRFSLPLPFGRSYYFAGSPITVPKNADAEIVEKIRKKLEDTMIQLVKTADDAAHRKDSPEPAPLV